MLVFWVLVAFLHQGCVEEPDCINSTTTNLRIVFKKKINGADTTAQVSRVTLAGSDSVYYAPSDVVETLGRVTIDVDPYQQETTFTLGLDGEPDRSVTVGYATSTRFISPQCGVETFISDLKVIQSDFDSVRISSSLLTPTTKSNLEIFR